MRRLLRLRALVALCVIGTLAAAAWWMLSVRTSQINNSLVLQSYCMQRSYLRRYGAPEPDFGDAKDFYGRPILYSGTRSLLVSYGKDGVPDRNYDAELAELATISNCYSANADTVFLDCRPVRSCFK